MTFNPIFRQLTPVDIPLDKIYLDPNNPRFAESDWVRVEAARIDEPEVQETARKSMVNKYAVDKLRMNMEVNGYLPIDRVIIRQFKPEKYVVLEGNRRICAAKMIGAVGVDGITVSPEVLGSLKVIPCLQYTGDNVDAAWYFQGIRHITGFVEWSAFGKAKLLVEMMEEEELSLGDVGRRFGLTSHGAAQWVRGYYAFKQAGEDSDYTEEVDERCYPYMQEIFSRSSGSLRDWLEWNEREYKFSNALNFNELISWLYPRPQADGETEGDPTTKGNWDEKWLPSRDDLRRVSYLLSEAKTFFDEFRRNGDIEKSYSEAIAKKYQETMETKMDPVDHVFKLVATCTKALDNIPFKAMTDEKTKARLLIALAELERAIGPIKQ